MKNFFKGVIFVSFFLPIIDGLVSLYNQAIEFFCLKIAEKSYVIRKRIQDEESENKTNTQIIGFQVPDSTELYDDDEGEDEI